MIQKIGFGGGCHWCTEAVFEHLKGVLDVKQGWINEKRDRYFSEAVIVEFNSKDIPLEVLIEIHLFTHSSTSDHSLRKIYRSAIYTFSKEQKDLADAILKEKQKLFDKPLVTKVYEFLEFKENIPKYLHYYKSDPNKPFCKTQIEPKLSFLLREYSRYYKG